MNIREQDKDYRSHTICIPMLHDDMITKLDKKMVSMGGERNASVSNPDVLRPEKSDEVITYRLERLDDKTIQAKRQIYEERNRKHKNVMIKDLLEE